MVTMKQAGGEAEGMRPEGNKKDHILGPQSYFLGLRSHYKNDQQKADRAKLRCIVHHLAYALKI
jgi:hypothetical protein